jgi:hypothetical protein
MISDDVDEGIDELGEAVAVLGYMIASVMAAVLVVCIVALWWHW